MSTRLRSTPSKLRELVRAYGAMEKSPVLAAVLNFLIWGLGYLYVGRRMFLGATLVAVMVVVPLTALTGREDVTLLGLVVGRILAGAAFARDAYQDARG